MLRLSRLLRFYHISSYSHHLGNAIVVHMDFEPLMASHRNRWKVVYLYGLFLLISTFGGQRQIRPRGTPLRVSRVSSLLFEA